MLSPIRRDDAAALFALQSNPDVMRWWNHPAWTRPAEAREQIDDDLAAHAIGTQLKLALRESPNGPLLGVCVAFAIDREAMRAEIGYLLAPDRQGQGYMHEALQQMLAICSAPCTCTASKPRSIHATDSAVYGLLANDEAAAALPV